MRDMTAADGTAGLEERIAELEHRVSSQARELDELTLENRTFARLRHIGGFGTWELVISTGVLHWSDEIFKMFGLEKETVTPSHEVFMTCVHPDDRDFVERSIKEARTGSHPYNIEHRIVLPSGEIRTVNERAEIVHGPDGRADRMLGVVTDISSNKRSEEQLRDTIDKAKKRLKEKETSLRHEKHERLKAQESLREREERFRTVFNSLNDAVYIHGPDGSVMEVNDKACESLGYTRDELLGMNIVDIDYEGDPVRIREIVGQLREHGHILFDARHGTKDGRVLTVEVNARIIEYDGRTAVLSLCRDMADRLAAEQALRESESLYRVLVDNFPNGSIYLFDRNLRYTLVGGSDLDDIGLDRETMVGLDLEEFLPPETARMLKERYTRTLEGIEQLYEIPFRDHVYETRIVPVVNDDGEVVMGMVMAQDITARKEAEEELRKVSREREELARIIERSPMVTYLYPVDEAIRFDHVSNSVRNFGYTPEDFYEGRLSPGDIVHTADVERFRKIHGMRHAGPDGEEVMEFRIMDGGGGVRWVEDHSWLRRDAEGRVTHVEGMLYDISRRMEAEQALRMTEQRMELAIEGADLGLWDYYPVTGDLYLSERWAAMLGYSVDELPQHYSTWEALVHPDDMPRVLKVMEAHKKGKFATYETEYRLRTKSGDWKWILARGKIVARDDGGAPLRFIGTHLDIDERKHIEAELKQYRDHLEELVSERTEKLERVNQELTESNKELDNFAYIVSHDLQEPLRVISAYSEFLMRDYSPVLGDDGCNKLTTLMRMSERLKSLIGSILYYSRVGRLDLSFEETDLDEVVRDQIDLLGMFVRENDVEIRFAGGLPTVRCDRVRIGEVFQNLITNAVKYNDKEHKVIEIGCTRSPGPDGACELYVRDNGIGIKEKHYERIFGIFKRLHARDKYGGGNGAGLTIVRKIIERHKGSIRVESVVGEGTTFHFTLS